jgi:hypothetical protein
MPFPFGRITLSLTGIPIALRVIYADRFVRGPFHLGRFSYPIAIAAVLWIAFISIVFCLPELNPVNSKTLNYAPVAVGIVLTYALGFWVISARRWFAGPIKQIAGAPVLYSLVVDGSGLTTCVSFHRGRERDGHQCCGVRETGVLGEEQGSLNELLELFIVEGREGRRTTPWRAWDSEREDEGVI